MSGAVLFSGVVVTLLLIALVGTVVWLYALIDAIRTPDGAFRTGSQLLWILVILLGNLIGAVVYLVVGRPRSRSG